MRKYIKENFKSVFIITLLIIATTALISSNELIAKRMPDVSELQFVSAKLEEEICDYTGQAVETKINELVFIDSEGNEVVKTTEEIIVENYFENVEIGKADIEVTLNGYRGTILLENVFSIELAQVKDLVVQESSREKVSLSWEAVVGADGYCLLRSEDQGQTFIKISENSSFVLTYQDEDIQTNSTYLYKVCAFSFEESVKLYARESEVLKHITPLAVPELTKITGKTYNSVEIQWNPVEGAIGYEVYRGISESGEYELVAELSDGAQISYLDETCECGTEYFYYIKACQQLDEERVTTEASNILSVITTPDSVKLSGKVSEDRTEVSLSWNKSVGAQGYELYRSSGASKYTLLKKFDSNDNLSYVDSGLEKDLKYFYKIRPYCVKENEFIMGSESNVFEKEVIIEFNYSAEELSGNIAGITQFVGAKYVYGGTTPNGWDCSGFTSWTLKNCYGITIPRTAAYQAVSGSEISLSDRSSWKPGDILAYTNGNRICHVALYIGNGQMMHALNEKHDTIIQSVDEYESWDEGTSLATVRRYH